MQDSITTKIKFLEEMGANRVPHSGRYLIDHLIGVHDILVDWKLPQYVCDAGLFHSIYGTMSFKHKTTNDRKGIKSIIGMRAEMLVYEFCLLNKPRLHYIGEIQDSQIKEDLVHINSANHQEQNIATKKEMTMDEAYGNLWNHNSGRRS